MENQEKYYKFLTSKMVFAPVSGFDIDPSEVSKCLLPHQRDAVIWAVRGGRRALFESFGLGKTLQQLEIIRIILKKEGGKGLIICPLGVKQEFKRDGKKFLNIEVQYVRTCDEIAVSTSDFLITNY